MGFWSSRNRVQKKRRRLPTTRVFTGYSHRFTWLVPPPLLEISPLAHSKRGPRAIKLKKATKGTTRGKKSGRHPWLVLTVAGESGKTILGILIANYPNTHLIGKWAGPLVQYFHH